MTARQIGMAGDPWKSTLPTTIILLLATLFLWIVGAHVYLTPSQKRAISNIHLLVNVALIVSAIVTIILFVRGRRMSKSVFPTESEKVESDLTAADQPNPGDRWLALVRSDAEIREAAELFYPYGMKWVSELGRRFIALGEDRRYLPSLVKELRDKADREEAEREESAREQATQAEAEVSVAGTGQEAAEPEPEPEPADWWVTTFRMTAQGELVTPDALAVLKRAAAMGYALAADDDRTIIARKENAASYMHSLGEIGHFGRLLGRPR
jgi:hypothetical protein